MAELSLSDKTSGKRMRQIVSILREHHVFQGLTPEKAVAVLEALGPTYVKIGQVASTRSDILPAAYCEAFAKLHADVDPLPYETVLACIDEAYGHSWEEVFLAIDERPLGSASIAQVHAAVLLDGTLVAVKVRRPGIAEEMAEDIVLMRHLLATAELLTTEHEALLLSFENLLDELDRTTRNELDFTVELENLLRFFSETERQEGVSSPLPFPMHSNESVLVMQYVEGTPIDDVERLRADGVDVEQLADRLVQSYISQVLDYGFFHADPHAGNVIVQGEGIVWIDLGMTGSLTSSERHLVSKMFQAVTLDDPYRLMEAVMGISTRHGEVETGELLRQLTEILEQYGSADLGDIRIGAVFGEVVEILRRHHLVVNPSVTMLARGFVTIEGLLSSIAPRLNVLDIVSRHVILQALDPVSVARTATNALATLGTSAGSLAKLPAQLSNTLDMLDKGELTIKADMRVDEEALATVYASVGRVSLALISVGLFLGSSILCTTNMQPKLLEVPVLGVLGYLGAFILGVYVIVQTLRSRHRVKNHRKAD